MVVRVYVPSARKGHETEILEVPQATSFVNERLQHGWIAAINGRVSNARSVSAETVRDGDLISLYPAVGGG